MIDIIHPASSLLEINNFGLLSDCGPNEFDIQLAKFHKSQDRKCMINSKHLNSIKGL
jgi:hypothetical protein